MTFIHPELRPPLEAPWSPEWDLALTRARNENTFANQNVAVSGTALHVSRAGEMEIRVWRPTDNQPTFLIYAIHGGGYTAGRARYDDQRNAEMALEFNAVVVSPDYRLAPEHPFPTPPEDCLSGLTWAIQQFPDLPIFLYGDSAGSGLVETVAAWHLDNDGRALAGLICLEPALDPLAGTRSMTTYANGPMWSHEKALRSWECYLGGQHHSELPRLIDRVESENFPPILVFVNPVDPLRDEGIEWALALADVGAKIELHLMQGTYHSALSISGTRTWRRVQNTIHDFIDIFHLSDNRAADPAGTES